MEVTNNSDLKLPVFNPVYQDATLTFSAADTLAMGVLMGQVTHAVGTATADAGNTGDGTVTLLAIGTGKTPDIGSWLLTCTDANAGGTATGAAVKTGTGNGTASAVTTGTETIEGDYIATCIDATVSGSEIFSVFDPNGVRLEDLTVGVAYSNNHLGITISDGSTDFIVGDYWTITMTIAHGGKFKLTDPNGIIVKDDILLPGTAAGTVAVDSGGLSFTITDGSTDFAAGDFFTLTVVAGSYKWKPYVVGALDGTGVPVGILPAAITVTASGDKYRRMLVGGEVALNACSIDAGGTIGAAEKKALQSVGIYLVPAVQVDGLDNQ